MKKILRTIVTILSFSITTMTFISAESVWTGNRELDWGSYISISASEFKHISREAELTFELKKTKDDYQNFKVYAPTNSGWKELKDGYFTNATYNGAIVPKFNHKNSTVTYKLTHENAENIRQYGLLIHGYGAKVTNVSINTKHNNQHVVHNEPKRPHYEQHKPQNEQVIIVQQPQQHKPHHEQHKPQNEQVVIVQQPQQPQQSQTSDTEVSTTISVTIGKDPSATFSTTVNKKH